MYSVLCSTAQIILILGTLISSSYACNNGRAIISGATNYPPLTWREDDRLTGATVKLIQMLLAEVGIDAQPDEGGPWKRVLLRAQRGQVDVLLGVRKTDDRESYLHYIEPPITPSAQSVFMSSRQRLFYERWDDLAGKAGGITPGASFGESFDSFAKDFLYLEQARTFKHNFAKLDSGKIDYLLGPLMTVILQAQKYGFSDRIFYNDTPLVVLNEYLAISKDSACLQYTDHLSKRINELQNNESWNDLVESEFILWFDAYE